MISSEHFFRKQVTKALYRYYHWQVYDKGYSRYEAGVYAEIRAKLDFDDIFIDIKCVKSYKRRPPKYIITVNPRYLYTKYPPLVRQTRGYCNNEITDIWTYLKRWINCYIYYINKAGVQYEIRT